MATITWDTPNFVYDAQSVIECLLDLNTKLLELGLIDYKGTNEAAINSIANAPIINISNDNPSKFEKLYYKLPVGNGVTKYKDVLGQDYKEIEIESFDSTEVYLEFEPQVYRWASYVSIAVYPLWNNPNGSHMFRIMCRVSNTDKFIGDACIFGKDSNPNQYRTSNSSIFVTYTKSFLSISKNNFYISWLHIYSNGMNDQYVDSRNYRLSLPTLNFSLYRKNGVIKFDAPLKGYMTETSNYKNASMNTFTRIITPLSDNTFDDQYLGAWPHNLSGLIDNQINLCNRYVNATGYFDVDYGMYITRSQTHTNVGEFSFIDVVLIDENYIKVKKTYINTSGMNKKWTCYINSNYLQYSFIFEYNDHPCTTEHLIEE